MATLAQDHTLAISATFVNNVEAAILRRVNQLFASGALVSDSGNLATAQAILANPAGYAALIARSVVTEAAVAARNGNEASLTDTEIQNAVNAVLGRYVR